MNRRFPPWLVLLALALLCAAVLGTAVWWRSRPSTLMALLERLPRDSGAIVYVDFAALRSSGALAVLGGSDMIREPEYRAFVGDTGFDYLRDLDTLVAAFRPSGTYFLLRGRFEWKLLKGFVLAQGGQCYNALCQIEGSTPARLISYFPIEPNTMGLAVSRDNLAAADLKRRYGRFLHRVPAQPVWAIVSPAVLTQNAALPSGTRPFARALQNAERVMFALGPGTAGMRLDMDVQCRSREQAAALVAQLREVTATLRDLIRKEGQAPNPSDLSGVLTAGDFEQRGAAVSGRWPVPRPLLEALAGGVL